LISQINFKLKKSIFFLKSVPPNRISQRIFIIVLVGDSGVGKTSFIHRFCHDTFRESFYSTIGILVFEIKIKEILKYIKGLLKKGIDFQIKNFIINGNVYTLQLWDTGEGFCSIY
jgi:GTPase SAR1 family protein